MQINRINRILLFTAIILTIPLIATQFAEQISWSIADFIIAGGLLVVTGLTYEFVANKIQNKKAKIIVGIVFLLGLLWIWVELAVGIFTNLGN